MNPHVFNAYNLLVKETGPVAKEIRILFLSSRCLCLGNNQKVDIFFLLPIIRFIADNLSPIDLINWSFSCVTLHLNKELQQSILPSLKNNLYKLLSYSGNSTVSRNLSILLNPGVCVLSGSIVLQAILGVRWNGSDIDIYCNNHLLQTKCRYRNVHQFLQSRMYTRTVLSSNNDNRYYHMVSATKYIDQIVDYFPRCKRTSPRFSKVQVIDLKQSISAERCVDHFDLDIVQNWFNGKVLYIKSVMSITRKIARVQCDTQLVANTIGKATGSLVNVYIRIQKLHDDGLIHIDIENWYPLAYGRTLKSIFLRIFSRYEKYIMRGFYVEDDKNLWGIENISVIMKRLHRNNKKMNIELLNHILLNTNW